MYPIDIELSPPIPVSTEKPQDAPDASPHDKSPNTTQTTPTIPLNPNHNANTPPTPQTTAETHAPPYTNSSPIRPRATPTPASATIPHPSTSHTTRTTYATHADYDTRLYENNSSTPETQSPPANAPAPTPQPPAPTTTLQAHSSPPPATASTPDAPASAACPACAHTPATADAQRVCLWDAAVVLCVFERNWLRSHRCLRERAEDCSSGRRYRRRRPAMAIGLTDHIWSWEEFLTYRHHHYSKG